MVHPDDWVRHKWLFNSKKYKHHYGESCSVEFGILDLIFMALCSISYKCYSSFKCHRHWIETKLNICHMNQSRDRHGFSICHKNTIVTSAPLEDIHDTCCRHLLPTLLCFPLGKKINCLWRYGTDTWDKWPLVTNDLSWIDLHLWATKIV